MVREMRDGRNVHSRLRPDLNIYSGITCLDYMAVKQRSKESAALTLVLTRGESGGQI